MGLIKNLSATAFASLSGMAMQALTAPLYLMTLTIHDFSSWLLATSIGAYLGLTVNGLFYSLMNKITIENHRGNREAADNIYCDTIYIVIYLATPLLALATSLFIINKDSISTLIATSLATTAINLTYVAMDANFRSMSRFAIGLNALSLSRILDWLVGIGAALVTKSAGTSLFCVMVYRLIAVTLALVLIQRLPGAMKFARSGPPSLQTLRAHILASRGQMAIAATSSSSAMAPQIIASAVFPGHLAVYFNIYRTYMRLLASGATTVTSAAWPILNKMYAERRGHELRRFFNIGLLVTAFMSTLGATFLVLSSKYIFPILFKSKVEIIYGQLGVIAFSVTISTMTIFCQSMFISTNMHSRALYLNLAISTILMAALFAASRTFGIYTLLFGLVLSEAISFISAFKSADHTIRSWQRTQAAQS